MSLDFPIFIIIIIIGYKILPLLIMIRIMQLSLSSMELSIAPYPFDCGSYMDPILCLEVK